MHPKFFGRNWVSGFISYLTLDWERERVSGEGMRIKSFILAILSQDVMSVKRSVNF